MKETRNQSSRTGYKRNAEEKGVQENIDTKENVAVT